jgi:uncharacterized repeat protein (TIGR01451 family)
VAEEDFESQIRPTPAGNQVYVVWNQSGASGTEAEFTMGTATFFPEADLALTASVSAGAIRDGDSVSVTLTVTNNGPDDASNVVVAGTVPTTLVSVQSAGGCAVAGGQVTCTVAALAPGASESFTLSLQATAVGTATVDASVTGDERDVDLSNNDDAVAVSISRSSSGGGSGGCAYNPGGPIDPTLPLMLLAGMAVLAYRRRGRHLLAAGNGRG